MLELDNTFYGLLFVFLSPKVEDGGGVPGEVLVFVIILLQGVCVPHFGGLNGLPTRQYPRSVDTGLVYRSLSLSSQYYVLFNRFSLNRLQILDIRYVVLAALRFQISSFLSISNEMQNYR